jgi:2-keto-4-pentenoate hydratase
VADLHAGAHAEAHPGREARIGAALALLLEARRTRRPVGDALNADALRSPAESFAVQDRLVQALGGCGGWKVGAGSAEEIPNGSPLPRAGIHPDGAVLQAGDFTLGLVELEVAFRFSRSLPGRERPYDAAEVLAAVGSVHAALEILDSRLAGWPQRPVLEQTADLCSHGALIVGPAGAAPASLDQRTLRARLWLDGQPAADTLGGNAAADLQRLLVWLANHAAARGTPIQAGDVVTTGSCTPPTALRPGMSVRGELPGVGDVRLRWV